MTKFIIGDISTFPVNLNPAIVTGSLLVSGSSSDPKIDIKGPAAGVAIRATGSIDITGNLTVGGTTTTINSTTLTVDDKNIELGSTASPSDTSADGGGITLKGASDYTIAWTNSTNAWHFNQGINVTSGNVGVGTTTPDAPLHIELDWSRRWRVNCKIW